MLLPTKNLSSPPLVPPSPLSRVLTAGPRFPAASALTCIQLIHQLIHALLYIPQLLAPLAHLRLGTEDRLCSALRLLAPPAGIQLLCISASVSQLYKHLVTVLHDAYVIRYLSRLGS
jgi:hypothetical protein